MKIRECRRSAHLFPGRLETHRAGQTIDPGIRNLIVDLTNGRMQFHGIRSFWLTQSGLCWYRSDRGPTLARIAREELARQLKGSAGRCTIVADAPDLDTLSTQTMMAEEPGNWAGRITQAVCHSEIVIAEVSEGIHLTILGKLSGSTDSDQKRFLKRLPSFLDRHPPLDGFFFEVLPWSYLYVTGSEFFVNAYQRDEFSKACLSARIFPVDE